MAYRFAGKQKVLAIGVYPAVGLREARDARDEAKRLLIEGQDPVIARKLAKAAHLAAQANTLYPSAVGRLALIAVFEIAA